MAKEDLSSPLPEEAVGNDDHPVARSQEGVCDRLEPCVTWPRDREHVRVGRGPEIMQHLTRLAVGLYLGSVVLRHRGLREFFGHAGGEWEAPRKPQRPRATG